MEQLQLPAMTLLIILSAITVQIFLTAKKVSPFLSLLVVSILSGFLLGMQPAVLLHSFEKGVSDTLGGLILVICLGAILGRILEASGAAEQIASKLIMAFGKRYIQWAVLLTGFLIGIPLFYNAGFIILIPLVFTIARKASLPLLYIAIPMAASLSVTHCFLPPHPSPVFLVNTFKADMGKTLLYGLLIAIPAVIIAGAFFGRLFLQSKVVIHDLFAGAEETATKELPSFGISILIALLPIALISLSVIAEHWLPVGNLLRTIFLFTGDATIALLIAVLLAVYLLGTKRGKTIEAMMKLMNEGVAGIAMIVLIITAGGIFKQVLIDSGTGDYIASFSHRLQLPPLVFAWAVTALLRLMLGSATVAGITGAGLSAPLVSAGLVSPELMVLAVGAGSVFGSHVNDSGFWMFKEFFKLSMKQTFLSWTIMESLISVLGLLGVLLLQIFFG